MKTQELIDTLVVDLRPTPRNVLSLRLGSGILLGSLASLALVLTQLGARPDLMSAMDTAIFWLRTSYTFVTAGISLFLAAQLARPGRGKPGAWVLLLPLLLYAPVGGWEFVRTENNDWPSLLFGHGWRHCTWLILLLAVPIYAGLLWSFRRFAPTQLTLAGAVAGIASAATSGVVYSLHCPANTVSFGLAWYTLAFILAGVAGACGGARLLRW